VYRTLCAILARADAQDATFNADEIAAWPDGAAAMFESLPLIRAAEHARSAVCDACGNDHTETVEYVTDANGQLHGFISCPDAGAVEVPLSRLKCWAVAVDELVGVLAKGLSLKGKPVEIVADRLWRLGHTDWGGAARSVMLARGLCWDDNSAVVQKADIKPTSIIFVPGRAPSNGLWGGPEPAVVLLSSIVDVATGKIIVKHADAANLVAECDKAAAEARAAKPAKGKKDPVTQQQLKSAIHSLMYDDPLIAAYRQYGSYQKAAAALSKEQGVRISKDKIFRAVKKAGGPAAVVQGASTGSVRRSVASQRRDKKRIF
jgi:hypothetical protein